MSDPAAVDAVKLEKLDEMFAEYGFVREERLPAASGAIWSRNPKGLRIHLADSALRQKDDAKLLYWMEFEMKQHRRRKVAL